MSLSLKIKKVSNLNIALCNGTSSLSSQAPFAALFRGSLQKGLGLWLIAQKAEGS